MPEPLPNRGTDHGLADLVAQGPSAEQRWRRRLLGDRSVIIGRESPNWSVPWDDRISRSHFRIHAAKHGWRVERIAGARNPIYFRGQPVDAFDVRLGEHWVVGRTTFLLSELAPSVEPSASDANERQELDASQLRAQPVREPQRHIAALSRLPELLNATSNQEELLGRLTTLLLTAIESAAAVAVIAVQSSEPARTISSQAPRILQWDNRAAMLRLPRPSERLVRAAAEREQSVLHVWQSVDDTGFTRQAEFDWAFCVPVIRQTGESWVIYVAGTQAEVPPSEAGQGARVGGAWLVDELRFTEVAASLLANLLRMQRLERRQAALRPYFAPVVMEALESEADDRILQPREVELTAIFCDLRGFSRATEAARGRLLEHLQSVSQTLGVITGEILRQEGVVGDFHGDSVLGFWGWPFEHEDVFRRAALTALAIRHRFRVSVMPGDPTRTALVRAGIGIASGRSVAGRIGSQDQVKVSAFGPPVNLASRLERLTKRFATPILIDAATAAGVQQQMSCQEARVRRIARIQPRGLNEPQMLYELLPPEGSGCQISDRGLYVFETAVEAWMAGDWNEAHAVFQELAPEDPTARAICDRYLTRQSPPADWRGFLIDGTE